MNCNNRHIPPVIELAELRDRDPITSQGRRRVSLSPRQALFYNDHPDEIIENFDRGEYRAVLREIERHIVEWEQQQTPQQAEWASRVRRRNHISTRAATRTIVETLRA